MRLVVRILEIAVLALAAWPLLRLLARRPLRRMFPRLHAAVAGALAAWIAIVALLAWRFPAALHPLALVAGLAAIGAAWRARPGRGAGRGWPPGSLSLTDSVEAIVDRGFYRRRADRHGPIFKMSQFHRPVACVVGLERGHRLLREHVDALGSAPQPFDREIPGGFLRYMDAETHRLYGPLFRRALSARVVEGARQVVDEAVGVELARAAGAARRSGRGSIRLEPYLENLVHAAFLRVLFGVDPDTEEFAETTARLEPLARVPLSDPLDAPAREALAGLRKHLVDLHDRARERGTVCALTELGRLDARMPDVTCLDNLVFIHRVSTSNLVGLLRWLVVTLGRRPGWIARLRSELDAAGPTASPDLLERVVLETLRLAQSEYLYRRLERDVEFEGFRLPAGWLVRVCVGESHRDPEVFEEAERFDPDRFLESLPQSKYAPFGAHHHACNGVPLTNLVCRAFLEAIVGAYDWRVEGPEELERDFRHWSHWRPASRTETFLAPISPPDRASPTGPAG